ncbi:MAG: hypothetical protein EOO38_08975 [Cytophagaceae bacterium]|nr:MAG: hypothetical protein EOO38_08975 [Cytophagaceae bacterium]
MPYVWQPDYLLFEVEWQRERERVFGLMIFAKDEQDAIRWAQEYLDEHPELEVFGDRDGTAVRAGRVIDRDDGKETVFYANEN